MNCSHLCRSRLRIEPSYSFPPITANRPPNPPSAPTTPNAPKTAENSRKQQFHKLSQLNCTNDQFGNLVRLGRDLTVGRVIDFTDCEDFSDHEESDDPCQALAWEKF